MPFNPRLRNLNRAKEEFTKLSKSARRKATIYKTIDIFIKAVLSVGGGLITYFADPTNIEEYTSVIRIFGIIIAGFTALASVFMFEKKSLANIQVYNKCEVVIPDIEYKIDRETNTRFRVVLKYKDQHYILTILPIFNPKRSDI
jgi:hypothetical protein